MSGRLTKLDVGWILALLVLVWLLGGRYFFSNLILARGDMFLYFYPYWQAASDGLRAGRLPLWNPDIFMGAPLLANSQMGFFYPLNWPFWLLLEVPAAVKGAVALHLGLAAAGTYLLGRKLILSRPAAGVAAFLFAGGGYLTAQIEHLNQLQGLAWLPWLLWIATFRPAAPAGRRRQTAGFALLFALQFLAGHTQTVFISGVTLLLYFATTLFLTPRSPSAAPRSPAPIFAPSS